MMSGDIGDIEEWEESGKTRIGELESQLIEAVEWVKKRGHHEKCGVVTSK